MIWVEEEEEQQVEQEEDNIDEHVDDLSVGMTVPLQQLLYSKIQWDFSKWESSILVPNQIPKVPCWCHVCVLHRNITRSLGYEPLS